MELHILYFSCGLVSAIKQCLRVNGHIQQDEIGNLYWLLKPRGRNLVIPRKIILKWVLVQDRNLVEESCDTEEDNIKMGVSTGAGISQLYSAGLGTGWSGFESR
jgi:UDP-N-acetylenolpyruvoylglucosamine reductase